MFINELQINLRFVLQIKSNDKMPSFRKPKPYYRNCHVAANLTNKHVCM